LGNQKGGSFTRDFDRWINGALEVQRLSMRELCEGNVEGGSFTGNPGGCVNEGSEDCISPHRGPTGEPGRGLLYQECGKMNEGGLSL
jgi:hypothetical protein